MLRLDGARGDVDDRRSGWNGRFIQPMKRWNASTKCDDVSENVVLANAAPWSWLPRTPLLSFSTHRHFLDMQASIGIHVRIHNACE